MTLKCPILKVCQQSPLSIYSLHFTEHSSTCLQILQDNNSFSVSTNLFSPWRTKLRTEAKGRVLGQEPASCRPRWTSWCCLFAHCLHAIQVNPFPTHMRLTAERLGANGASVNSSVLISQCWPHRWVRGHA